MQSDETNRQIAQTSRKVALLAETNAEFTESMLRFITSQTEFYTWTRIKLDKLIEAEHRIQQEISGLTKTIKNFMKLSSGNGNSLQE